MAYAKNVNIKRGDLIMAPVNGNTSINYNLSRIGFYNSIPSVIIDQNDPLKYPYTVNAIDISPNGRYLATGGGTNFNGTGVGNTIILFDLEEGSIKSIAAGNSIQQLLFTPDSLNLMCTNAASGTAFKIFDVVTGVELPVPGGTYTLSGSGNTRMARSVNKVRIFQYSTSATASVIYDYNYTTNTITEWLNYGVGVSAIGFNDTNDHFYVARGTTGTATANISVYAGSSTTPIGSLTNSFLAQATEIKGYGDFVAVASSSASTPDIHIVSESTGSTVTSGPTKSAPYLSISRGNSISVKDGIFFMVATNYSLYPISLNTSNTVVYVDTNGYTSGLLTPQLVPSVPRNVSAVLLAPGFKRNKVSGFVYDKNGNPAGRDISVFIGDTLTNTGVSNPTTGKFSIPLMTDAEVRIVITGDGTETTQLLDKIVPVDINATDCVI